MKKSAKRLLALILAMAMALSLLSASVWAAEEEAPASSAPAEVEVQEEAQEEKAPEDESAPEEEPEAAPQEEEAPEEEPEAAPQEEEAPEEEPEAQEEDPAVEAQDVQTGPCGESLTYSLDDNGVMTISGTGAMWDYDDENVRVRPWNNYDIKKLVVEDGVTSIGADSFNGAERMKVATIPASVTSIGARAFQDCYVLYSIALPAGVTIGENAFYWCSNLTKVTNGESNVDAFANSTWWLAQKFPTAMEMKEGETKDFTVKGTDTQYVFIKYAPAKNTRNGLRVVDDSVKDCNGFSLRGPFKEDGTDTNDNGLFYGGEVYCYVACATADSNEKDGSYQLTITEEKKPTEGKFDNEAGEEDALSWKFADGTLTVSGKGVVGYAPWDGYGYWGKITALVVEDGVTGWDTSWFEDSSHLATVTLAPSVAELDTYSFAWCSELATVTLTEDNFTLATIAKAFRYTPWLAAKKYKDAKEIKVGESATVEVTDVSKMAVFKFVAPEDGSYVVTAEAGTYAYPRVSLRDPEDLGYYTDDELGIAEANPDPTDKDEASRDLEKDELVYVTAGGELPGKFSITVTKQDQYSGKCGEEATWKLEDGVLTISGKGRMDNASPWASLRSKKIKKVVIEEGITSIDEYAFSGCEELTEVSLPSTLRTIGNHAFQDCEKLPSVKLNDGLAKIGNYAFDGCEELSEVNIPEGVKSIGYYAFYDCPKLKKVFVPDSVEEIGEKAFGFYTDDEGKQDQKVEGFTLLGKTGSAAEKYAKEAEIPFTAHEAHTYTAAWTWAADNTSGEVTFTCSGCGLSEKVTTTNITVATDPATKKTTYTATVEFKGQTYTDTKVVEPVEPQANTIKTDDTVFFTYNTKKAQKKTLSVKVKGGAKLTFKSNSKKVKVNKNGKVTVPKKFKGKAKITITAAATDSYKAAKKTVLIMVGPSATKLGSVKGAKKSFTAKWKKNKMAKAYKIQYSTKKDFSKKVKSVKVKGAKSVKTTVKKLKKGTYYVRLRTEDGSTYSKWSKVVKVKVK